MNKIVAFHLYNDFSGSPKALRTVLEGLLNDGYSVDLYTSKGGVLDCLSQYEGCRIIHCRYRYTSNKIMTMFRFLVAQITIFFHSLKYLSEKECVFYINTIMPVGAAFAGRMMGKRVVYHYHENAHIKGGMYSILCRYMEKLADKIMCVSAYQSSFLKRSEGVYVVPNALESSFIQQLKPDVEKAFEARTVLMLSSLKAYKGLVEFFKLARLNKDLSFVAVINDISENIEEFIHINDIDVPDNMTYYSRQSNVAQFYNAASLSLNLSRKSEFVETFGLTALEAMSCALPVIVPTVGGIAEMVEDGVNGYKIDVENLNEISCSITRIFKDKELYCSLAANSLAKSREFSLCRTVTQIESVLNG